MANLSGWRYRLEFNENSRCFGVCGYFFLEIMSIMYINRPINATKKVIALKIVMIISNTDTGFTPFTKVSANRSLIKLTVNFELVL